MASGVLGSADCVSFLQESLRKCTELHDSKCQITPPKDIPNFWVIDSQKNCLVPGNSVDKYAALSYVWRCPSNASSDQTPAERPVLQWSNLNNFRTPGYLSESGIADKLPEVIQDSIDFVKQSGVRYLWVDCLCIAQNDETTAGNVLSMREIYSGAYFTIIAAAKSPGLYGAGTNTERDREETPIASSLHGALFTTHWATRGWTFQEQMLSKRSFVFLDDAIFWDCQGDVWSLFSNYFFGLYGDRIAGMIHTKKLLQSLATPSIPNFRLYMELICRYNHRDLTYAQDALPAISGVLDALTCGFPGDFISGLPAVFLDSSLLWQPLLKAKRRVRSDEKSGPSPPLPSWSWVGWQCLVDPASLESGLDYEVQDVNISEFEGLTRRPITPRSRRTRKLIDWISSTTGDDECTIHEPGILEKYKGLRDSPSGEHLPTGWSHETEDKDCANQPNDWYSHESDITSRFHYPLPTTVTPSTVGSQGPKCFLSCTAFTAKLNVRRVLLPHDRVPLWGKQIPLSALSFSARDTEIYQRQHDLEMYCSVVTLEDNQGRWAGLLRVMDDNINIKSQQTIEVIAISQGNSSYLEAAMMYEEMVDRLGCYRCGDIDDSDHYHFLPMESFPQKKQEERKSEDDTSEEFGANSAVAYFVGWDVKSECYKSMEKEAERLDHGPFFLKDISCSNYQDDVLPKEWEQDTYEFYNVLWIERRGDFMERKAAGRVPKDIWEQNQGELRKIRLG